MNGNIFKDIAIFCVGAAAGSLITWKIVKTKYEQLADEEIESVKDAYKRRAAIKEEAKDDDHIRELKKKVADLKIEQTQPKEYDDIRSRYAPAPSDTQYDEEEDDEDEDEDEEDENMNEPYSIPPEELGLANGYGDKDSLVVSLDYFADGVLADEQGKVVEDADELVGKDFATHFGEYEDDAAYIRNDRIQTDFEILKDGRTYEQACADVKAFEESESQDEEGD